MKLASVLNTVVNVAVVAALGYALFRPGGPARAHLATWQQERATARALEQRWDQLAVGAARLDAGAGPVRLIEFADYQCPYCRLAHERLQGVLTDSTVGVAYRHLPIATIHPAAEGAARAAICAQAQGRFTAMHGRLFEESVLVEAGAWSELANAADVPDLDAFAACLESDATTARLAADRRAAERLGILGTPSFVHAGGVIRGMATEDALRAALADGEPVRERLASRRTAATVSRPRD